MSEYYYHGVQISDRTEWSERTILQGEHIETGETTGGNEDIVVVGILPK